MKQKTVIKVQMNCDKCRKEAMKIAASTSGVISVALQGNDKDQIAVVGNEVDSAGLCNTLRKKVGYATLVSIEEVKDPKPEEKKPAEDKKKTEEEEKKKSTDQEKKKPTPPLPPHYHYNYCHPHPQYYMYNFPVEDRGPVCTIM